MPLNEFSTDTRSLQGPGAPRQGPPRLHRDLGHRLHILLTRDFARYCQRSPPCYVLHLGYHASELLAFRWKIVHGDVQAILRQPEGDAAPDAPSSTGHERDTPPGRSCHGSSIYIPLLIGPG